MLPCKQSSTAEHTRDHPPCRAERFARCRPGHSMQQEKKPSPLHTDKLQDEVQKPRCVVLVGDLVSMRESQGHGASRNGWDGQESSSQRVLSTSTAGKQANTSPDPINPQPSGGPRPTLVFPCVFTLKCEPVTWLPVGPGLIQHAIQ